MPTIEAALNLSNCAEYHPADATFARFLCKDLPADRQQSLLRICSGFGQQLVGRRPTNLRNPLPHHDSTIRNSTPIHRIPVGASAVDRIGTGIAEPIPSRKKELYMNRSFHKRLASFAAILTLISTGAFAAAETKAGPAAYVDDATVTVKVKTALIESPEVKAHQVEVETRRGVVQLNGFVDSAAAKNSASRITMAVKGVNEVHNNLVIADKTTVNEKVDDGMLTAKVKAALIADPATKAYQINVTTKLGMVQLSGFVDSMSQKSKATDVARSVAGVKDVDNVLEIKGP